MVLAASSSDLVRIAGITGSDADWRAETPRRGERVSVEDVAASTAGAGAGGNESRVG